MHLAASQPLHQTRSQLVPLPPAPSFPRLPGRSLLHRVNIGTPSSDSRLEDDPVFRPGHTSEHSVGCLLIPFNGLVGHRLCCRGEMEQCLNSSSNRAAVSDTFPLGGHVLPWELGFGESNSCHRARALQHLSRCTFGNTTAFHHMLLSPSPFGFKWVRAPNNLPLKLFLAEPGIRSSATRRNTLVTPGAR